MTKLRCKKEYGKWFYEKESSYDLDEPIYNLYNEEGKFISTFGGYNDMKYFVETGTILC